jgi:transporter family protein
MVEWYLVLALLSAALWAISNVTDKVVVSKHIERSETTAVLAGVLGPVVALPLVLSGSVRLHDPTFTGLALLAGILYVVPFFLYFRSLRIEEVSRVVPMLELVPVFTVLLAAVFLDERFTIGRYAGIALLVTGAVLISLNYERRSSFHLELTGAFWLVLIASVLFAASSVLTKYLLQFSNIFDIYFWSRLGGVVPAILALLRSDLRTDIRRVAADPVTKRVHYLIGSETLNLVGLFVFTVALSLGPVSLVSAASSVQPLLVLGIVWVIAFAGRGTFEERLTSSSMSLKIASGGLIICGIYLIN